MPNVLWVSHVGVVAGGERSMLAAIEHQPADFTTVLASPPGPLVERAAALGAAHEPLPAMDLSLRPHPVDTPAGAAAIVRAGVRLRRIVEAHQIDAIVANTTRPALAALLVPQRVPVIGYAREMFPGNVAARVAHGFMTRRSAAVIANSRATAALLPRGRAPLTVVHNAVDRGAFGAAAEIPRAEVRRRLGVDDDRVLVAVIGYMAPRKAQDDAIRALAAAKTDRPWELLLIGARLFPKGRVDYNAYADGLLTLAAELGVADRVRMLGGRDDVPELLRAIDVLLVPSHNEPFSRVVIEGMWSGCTVLATTVGGPPELITDGVDGLLLEPRAPAAWGAALTRLFADPSRAAALGAAAAAKAQGAFDPVEHGEQIGAVVRQAIAAGRR